MSEMRRFLVVGTAFLMALGVGRWCAGADATLPEGVKAVWDMAKAERQVTPTRESFCINGLWRWQPVEAASEAVPGDNWGYVRVPGPMPTGASRMQAHYPHPSWQGKERDAKLVWYQREIDIPASWKGRRIVVRTAYLNKTATMYVDGKKGGVIVSRGGEAEITGVCEPGKKQVLSIFVETTGGGRAGLVGDVYLESMPKSERIDEVKIDPSVREWKLTLDTAVTLEAGKKYVLKGEVLYDGKKAKDIQSEAFGTGNLKGGRYTFSNGWQAEKLWDLNTPANKYELKLSLAEAGGKVADEYAPVRFGFRELWINGKDLYLNGSRIQCFEIPLDNGGQDIGAASYEGAKETLERMKAIGVNMMFTHNYGCNVGSHLSFEDIMKAADDVGMLLSISAPHFWAYQWDEANADETNGYLADAEFYVRQVQNHPSVVFYSTSHNGTGYADQQNPDRIDGKYSGWPDPAGKYTRVDRGGILAARAQALIERFDMSRPVYHHDSGNLGRFYTSNCYLDFVPVQERTDWFEHWSKDGVKPLLLVEYGVPLEENWINWREGHAVMGQNLLNQFLFAEWGAQWRGDKAYQITDAEKANIRYEAKAWRDKRPYHKSQMPFFERNSIPNVREVQAMYIKDNWPAFRTWGVSGMNAWAQQRLWENDPEVRTETVTVKVDWEKLQRPGYKPDIKYRLVSAADATKEAKWKPVGNAAGKALLRYNQPVLAYIAGKAEAFTSKDHNFTPGETLAKQIIVINNSRETVTCEYALTMGPVPAGMGTKSVTVKTGEQARVPMNVVLPEGLKAGRYEIKMTAKFSNGTVQEETFTIDVMAKAAKPAVKGKIALFDPKGETTKLLTQLGIPFTAVNAQTDMSGYDTLVIGKHGLTMANQVPALARVRDGLKVIVFEQTTEVMERRMGFRTQEYVLREVFPRLAGVKALDGLTAENLTNWRGEGTTVPARLQVPMTNPSSYPMMDWCGLSEPRAWRCGCRGSVASVLLEKPTVGDWLPLVDGGFSLQYSPLLEYREGKGMVLFCQMDVTGRTEADPAAMRLAGNIMSYVDGWKAPTRRAVYCLGDPAVKAQLESLGIKPVQYGDGAKVADSVLVVGSADTKSPVARAQMGEWVQTGMQVLAIGLDQEGASLVIPGITMNKAEYINGEVPPQGAGSAFAGVAPADVYDRDAREINLITGGAETVANGVLARSAKGNVVLCQLAPWEFDYKDNYNLKITNRRTSFLVSRLLGNMGASGETPVLKQFAEPLGARAELDDVADVVWLAVGEKEEFLPKTWKGLPLGTVEPPTGWEKTDYDDAKWREMKVPGMWESQYPAELGNLDGLFLYRVAFDVSAETAGQEVTLVLGAVDDEDWTHVNGQLVGSMTKETNPTDYWAAVRTYKLPKGTLKAGRNVVAVKVNDIKGSGGMKASVLKRHGGGSTRWLSGLYLDKPEMLDDVYRYYCW